MARRPYVLALLAPLVLVAACSSSGAHEAATTTTTVEVHATTTTAAPIQTTTSTAPPPRLPAASTAGEVRALITSTGVVVPVYARAPAGWQVGTPCGNRAVVAQGTPIRGATVLLDPGHGGFETGAVGANGLVERDLNLAVAKLVRADLQREGASVVMTRTADYRMTLDARSALAQRLKPPVFISIHHNGGADGSSDKPGTETYYQHASPASKRLAGLLYEEELKVFAGRPGIEWHANVDAGAKFRLNDRGGDYYGVLRGTHGVTSVISEGLFLSASRSEADLLARPDVQAAEAEAITRAVRRFMLGSDPGSGFVQPILRQTPAGGGGGPEGCVDPPLSR
jgi:N-acetylmuramoyl-L-alanine amidase